MIKASHGNVAIWKRQLDDIFLLNRVLLCSNWMTYSPLSKDIAAFIWQGCFAKHASILWVLGMGPQSPSVPTEVSNRLEKDHNFQWLVTDDLMIWRLSFVSKVVGCSIGCILRCFCWVDNALAQTHLMKTGEISKISISIHQLYNRGLKHT